MTRLPTLANSEFLLGVHRRYRFNWLGLAPRGALGAPTGKNSVLVQGQPWESVLPLAAGISAGRISSPIEPHSPESRTGLLNAESTSLAVTLSFTTIYKGKIWASDIKKELEHGKVSMHQLPVREVDAPARNVATDFAARVCAVVLVKLPHRIIDHNSQRIHWRG